MTYKSISVRRLGATAVIAIDNPPVNALHPEVADEILAAVDGFRGDAGIRSLVLTGTGRFFVAGGDIKYFQTLDRVSAEQYALGIQRAQAALHELSVPVIAAVNGVALGGGCELIMSCDIRIADEQAMLGQPEVRLGVIPGAGGMQMLPRLVPIGIAKRLLFTGDRISAREALSIGLVDEVVDHGKALEAATALAARINANAPQAVANAKRCVNRGLNMALSEALRLDSFLFGSLFESSDVKEGVSAFIEKREPHFTGR